MRLRSLFVAAALGLATPSAAQSLLAEGGCRDGQPNGAYLLRASDGALRVAGAFARGRLTGTFVFWAGDGVRLAVIPYDDGVKSGTVATWYPRSGSRGESRRKLEAPYVGDRLHGVTRSWYPGGRPRGEYRYEHGELVEATAWSETGARLRDDEARRLAAADRLAAEKTYASLEREVADHAPPCL